MILTGFASTARLDDERAQIAAGAFDLALAERGVAGIKFLLDHDHSRPAGHFIAIGPRDGKLWAEAMIDPKLPGCAACIRAINAGAQFGFSVGGRKRRFGRRDDGSIIIHTADLHEISLTAYPRNADCMVAAEMPAPKRIDAMAEIFAAQAAAAAAARPFKMPDLPIRYHQEEQTP